MASNLSDKLVAWVDKDGGSHTGRQVLSMRGSPVIYPGAYVNGDADFQSDYYLVKETHCGTLTWVKCRDIVHMPTRADYENADGSLKPEYGNPLLVPDSVDGPTPGQVDDILGKRHYSETVR